MATKKREVAELTAPDPFMERANEYAGWVEKNLRKLITIAIVALLVLIGALFFSQRQERQAASVTADLSNAIEGYDEATNPSATMTATTPEAMQKLIGAATPKLETLVKDHGNHGAGRLSRLYLADLARRAGDHPRAEQLFKEYASSTSTDDPLLFFAYEGAGYALEEQKKLDEALQYFVKMQDLPGKELDDLALKHQARVHELKGDREAAIKAYRAILDQFAESKQREFAEYRLSVLE